MGLSRECAARSSEACSAAQFRALPPYFAPSRLPLRFGIAWAPGTTSSSFLVETERMRIHVTARNGTFPFDSESGEGILFAGLRGGVALPYECATGTCGTCKARLIDGQIDAGWAAAPGRKFLDATQGEFLMCQSVAYGDVSLSISKSINAVEADACPAMARTGTISELHYLTHDVATIAVRLDARCDFDAGQFMAVSAPGVRGMRGYSMVNFARATDRLEFLIKKKPGGGFSEWLFGGNAKGAKLEMFGPLGKATFSPGIEEYPLYRRRKRHRRHDVNPLSSLPGTPL